MTMASSTNNQLRFGANYTPAAEWFHSWMAFSPDAVRRDFEALATLGLDHVRVFPLWTLLQPNRTLIRSEALDDVRKVVDIAREFAMDASVDIIQGHLSSFDFVPTWLTSWHDTNMFTNKEAIEAQVNLVEALGNRLSDSENFLGFTLGNETNQFSTGIHPTPWPTTIDEAGAWLTSLLDAAERSAPGRHHTHSEYDAVWFMDGHGFTPRHAATLGASTTIHSWIFNGTAQRYGGRSAASERLAEYLIEVSRAFQDRHDRPIWLQEVGAPSNCLTENEMPGFLEATVRNAARSKNLWGVTWWCSHDVSRSLADFPELEYSLGLIDQTGAAKPIGQRFSSVATELRRGVTPVDRNVGIVIPVEENGVPISRGAVSPGGVIFEAWNDACADGIDATFITSIDAENSSLVAERGITEFIVPDLSKNSVGAYASVNTVVE